MTEPTEARPPPLDETDEISLVGDPDVWERSRELAQHVPAETLADQAFEPGAVAEAAVADFWRRLPRRQRVVIGAVIVGVSAISGLVAMADWPWWAFALSMPGVGGLMMVGFDGLGRRAVYVTLGLAALAAALVIGWTNLHTDLPTARKDAPNTQTSPTPVAQVRKKKQKATAKFPFWAIPLGAKPQTTVVWGVIAWTLTDDHRLIAGDLRHEISRKPLEPRDGHGKPATRMLLCGDVLALLFNSGKAELRSARDGHVVGHYPFAHGRAGAAHCSAQLLWIKVGRVLDRINLRALGRRKPTTVVLHKRADRLLAWNSMIVGYDLARGRVVGYDERRQNAVERATTGEGLTALLPLGQTMYAFHRDEGCIRRIDFDTFTEAGGFSLPTDVTAEASDGATLAFSTSSGDVAVIDESGGTSYHLPIAGLTIKVLAVSPDYLVLGDAHGQRVIAIERASLKRLKAKQLSVGNCGKP